MIIKGMHTVIISNNALYNVNNIKIRESRKVLTHEGCHATLPFVQTDYKISNLLYYHCTTCHWTLSHIIFLHVDFVVDFFFHKDWV